MCQAFQCLPDAGGLLDQDSTLMQKIAIVYSAQQEKEKLEQEIEAKRPIPQPRDY